MFAGSPNGIRTRVTGLRTLGPGPLDDGATLMLWLGDRDSNPDFLIQSQASCQLDDPPISAKLPAERVAYIIMGFALTQ